MLVGLTLTDGAVDGWTLTVGASEGMADGTFEKLVTEWILRMKNKASHNVCIDFVVAAMVVMVVMVVVVAAIFSVSPLEFLSIVCYLYRVRVYLRMMNEWING